MSSSITKHFLYCFKEIDTTVVSKSPVKVFENCVELTTPRTTRFKLLNSESIHIFEASGVTIDEHSHAGFTAARNEASSLKYKILDAKY